MPNVDRIAEDFDKRGAPSVAVPVSADGGGGNGNGVVDQIFESGKHVEVILGARTKAASRGDAISAAPAVEYLVKWIGHSHIHNSWMAEDPLDQLAPAKFGEYVLQYGRVPRMLADERWSKPQRVVAGMRVGGSPAATSDPGGKTSPDSATAQAALGGGARGGNRPVHLAVHGVCHAGLGPGAVSLEQLGQVGVHVHALPRARVVRQTPPLDEHLDVLLGLGGRGGRRQFLAP